MALLKDGTRIYGTLYANTEVVIGSLNVSSQITTAFDKANSAGIAANTPSSVANAAYNHANAAFIAANTGTGATGAYNTANAAFIAANNAAGTNLTQNNSIVAAFNTGNAAFIRANTPSSVANASFNHANAAFNIANLASANTLSLAGILTGAVGGVTSYYFNGSSQGIRLPTTSNLDFGSGDFTIEFWMNAGSSQQPYAMIADALTVNDKTGIGVNQNDGGTLGYLRFRAQSGYAVLATTTFVLDNTWRHIACVKSGSNGYLFVNGTLEASTSAWSGVSGASLSDGQIGRSRYGGGTSSDNTYTGYISNFRILKGTALYTSGFTVPAFTLNAITNTQLLISSGTTVSDSSNNALTFTAQTVLPNSSTTIVPSITANGASNGSIVGTAVDTFARNQANAAFAAANTGGGGGADQYARNTSNAAFNHANAAFIAANTGGSSTDQLARDTANSKSYIFYQNTAPATSNSNDIWVNTDNGALYENFGTTSAPVWAEAGPTNAISNTPPGTLALSTLNILSHIAFTGNQRQTVPYQGYGIDNVARDTANSTAIRANNSLNANNGGTVTSNVVVVGNVHANLFITTGAGGDISNANTVYSNSVSTGNVTVSTLVTAANVVVNNNITVKANSTVLGNSSISGLLTVGGNANVAGTLNVSSNLFISGISAGYAPNRPAFRITGNGGSILASSTVAGGYMVVDYNQGNYLNTTTGIFTAPIPGLYQVNLTVRTFNNTNATINQAIIYKNATSILMIEFGVNTSMNHTGGSTVIKLAAGDTLKFDVTVGQISFDGNDNWSVAYIG
jgi:hypothetical protein